MILTKLKEYADNRMTLPPPRYNKRFAAWFISLTEDGKFEGCICLKGSKKEEKKGKEFEAPDRKRSGKAIRPKLLFDSFEYVLGIGRPDVSIEKVASYHEHFKALVQDCAAKTMEPTVIAVAKFLSAWEPTTDRNLLPKDIDPSENVTFRVGEIFPADAKFGLTKIQEFWLASLSNSSEEDEAKGDSPIMQCLITENIASIAKRMPISIKGLSSIGGNPTGTELVSANQKPFTSYGLENSLSSPISVDAAERFAKALNSLIADERSRMYIGSTVYVYWTKEKIERNPFSMLKQPKSEEVEALLKSLFTSEEAVSLTEAKVNQFYALALTANNARAVVRDWLETTVSNVWERLQLWFRHQQMIEAWGKERRWFSVSKLADHLYRRDPKTDRAAEDVQASILTALIRNAIHSDRIPEDILTKLIQRNRVEREITYPRAVLIKLIFSSDPNRKEMMTNMEELNRYPNLKGDNLKAYLCGQLFAVLESLQRAAIGSSVNSSLADRYYGAASSTPNVALSPLLKLRQAHLSKLRKKQPGTCTAIENRLMDIFNDLPQEELPKSLNLTQQGLFGLGYYHQRAEDRATAKAKSEAKKLG